MRTVGRAVWLGTLIASLPCVPSGQAAYELIVRSGEMAPGTADAFRSFSNPVINAAGAVAFQARLSAPMTDVVPHGVWAGSRTSLRPVAIAGAEAPGTDGARFQTPGWPNVLTSDSETLFYGHLVHDGGVTSDNDYGIWVGPPDEVRLLARRSDPAPGLPAGTSYSLFFANPHSSGRVGFSTSLHGPGVDSSNNSAAWIGQISAPNSLQLIARGGDAAPDLPIYSYFVTVGTPTVNASGQVVLWATATIAPSAAQETGLWAGAPANLHLLAISDGLAPGTLGRKFDFFNEPRLNNAGQVAFTGYLASDSDEQRLSDVGIWAGAGTMNGMRSIALESQQAPGFEPGTVFRGSALGDEVFYEAFSKPELGGGGHVAFVGTVFGDTVDFDHNDGVWVSGPVSQSTPSLTLVAREGDHPPGTAEGTHFAGIFTGDDLIPAFERPSINAAGQIAFQALTTGPMGEFGRGIWATDAAGDLHLIAHEGQNIPVGPGDEREIALLKLHAGGSSDDGHFSPFNDAGQLAFAVSFTDGSEALILSNVVAHLAGDFNNDRRVDAADYVSWRNRGAVLTEYETWRANFGRSFGSSSATAITSTQPLLPTVPELPTALMSLFAVWAPRAIFRDGRKNGTRLRSWPCTLHAPAN